MVTGSDETKTPRVSWLGRHIYLNNGILLLSMIAIVLIALWDGRTEALRSAKTSTENLREMVVSTIDNYLAMGAFVIDMAASEIGDANDPTPSTDLAERRTAHLQSALAQMKGASSLMVFDGAGRLLSGAGDVAIGPARDALYRDLASQAGARATLSKPFADPDAAHMSVALTRRLPNPDGTPGDLVALTLRLSYFRDLFVKLAVGDGGAVALIRSDGIVLLREPSSPELRTSTNISHRQAFHQMEAESAGLIDLSHATAGAPRLVAFGTIPRFDLLAAVSTSYASIYGGWEWRAVAMGAVMFGVCFLALMLAVALRQELKRRMRAEAHLATLAITDPLTGLANRRRFDEVLEREWRRTGRTGSSLALLMIDADRFKELNDMFGHLRGDEVLRSLARIIAQNVRETEDLAARYGGEEFAVILPDVDQDEAFRVAERIRERTGQERIQASRSLSWDLSVSIGVAFARPALSAQAIDLIETADRALYAAKNGGRDRVVVAVMTEPGGSAARPERAGNGALNSPAG